MTNGSGISISLVYNLFPFQVFNQSSLKIQMLLIFALLLVPLVNICQSGTVPSTTSRPPAKFECGTTTDFDFVADVSLADGKTVVFGIHHLIP